MANDAMLISIDQIRFQFLNNKKMKVYAIGVTADSLGKVILTAPPTVTPIVHKPKVNRPAVWDFAGDGYSIYQRLGGLPDFVAGHLIIVRDRSNLRNTGELLTEISNNAEVKDAASAASEAIKKGSGVAAMAASAGLGLIQPVVGIIGKILGQKRDKVLTTLSGSFFLDPERSKQSDFTDSIRSPDNNIVVDIDAVLFDAQGDDFDPIPTPDLGIELAGLVQGVSAGTADA